MGSTHVQDAQGITEMLLDGHLLAEVGGEEDVGLCIQCGRRRASGRPDPEGIAWGLEFWCELCAQAALELSHGNRD